MSHPKKDRAAWLLIASFGALVALSILVGAGGFLRIIFPVGSCLVGLFLYLRHPVLYMGFTWWLWFLTAIVRRFADWQAGWQDPSMILLTPYLVTFISLLTFVIQVPRAKQNGNILFVVAGSAIGYSLTIGVINSSLRAVLIPFLNWFAPILFGFHILMQWRNYPQYRTALERTFLWGVIVMGAYGLIQYLAPQPWDAFWMNNVEMNTIGSPKPYDVRVFSTMNSPGPFSGVMTAGLLLLLSNPTNIGLAASGLGYLSFLLASVRSTWGGWVIGFVALFAFLKPRLKMRLVLMSVALLLLLIPLSTLPAFQDNLSARFSSLSNLAADTSYRERQARYVKIFGEATTQVVGQGLGGNPELHIDSGILDLLFSFGWVGTIIYLSAAILALLSVFSYSQRKLDSFIVTARSISLCTFAQIGLGSSTYGIFGVIFWGFIAMSMAGARYNEAKLVHQQASSLKVDHELKNSLSFL